MYPSYLLSQQFQDLNLGFEDLNNGKPLGWHVLGSPDYLSYIDSKNSINGDNSAVLESNGISAQNVKAWIQMLPENYKGEKIKLKGFIKTENIKNGYAGLMIRLDPGVNVNIMDKEGVTGTNAWKEYEISLPLNNPKVKSIAIGGVLVGEGKAWFDHFQVFIDDVALENINVNLHSEHNNSDPNILKSNITIENKNDQTCINNLAIWCKLWGFLKYNHPEIAKGTINWDVELFKVLAEIAPIQSSEDLDDYLINYLKILDKKPKEVIASKVETSNTKNSSSEHNKWIYTSNFSEELITAIELAYANRLQSQEKFYVKQNLGSAYAEVINENPYSDIDYPDDGFRLLSLFRYWNIIHYFSPYKDIIKKDWDNILVEYIPIFLNAKNRLDYEIALIKIIGEINDSHANIWGGGYELERLKGNYFPYFQTEFVENKLIVKKIFNTTGSSPIQVGDEIMLKDFKSIDYIVDSIKYLYPASNEAAQKRDMALEFLRSNNDTLQLKIKSYEGKVKTVHLKLVPKSSLNFKALFESKNEMFKLLDKNIGYINASKIKFNDIEYIKNQIFLTKGLIIDLRDMLSTDIVDKIASIFVTTPTPFLRKSIPNLNNPGEFIVNPPTKLLNGNKIYEHKVIVLIDENTQSSGEWTAMGLKIGKQTTLLGSPTAGADGNMSFFHLPGGIRTAISGIGVYYPDGGQTQQKGIIPDVIHRSSIKGISEGRDELIEKALDLLNANY